MLCSFYKQTFIHIYVLELDIDRYEDLKHQTEFIWYHRKGIITCFNKEYCENTYPLKRMFFLIWPKTEYDYELGIIQPILFSLDNRLEAQRCLVT